METAETAPDVVSVRVTADASQMQAELGRATGYGRLFTSTLIQAFDGLAGRGKGFNAVLGQLSLSLSSLVLKAALKPLEQGFSDVLSGLFGGVGGPSPTAFARGGVLKGGLPVPFASGGVIASPITFPLADGRTGLAGERGAEAILPLARGPDGRLGVASERSGSGPMVVFNISTPDAQSFRRSETQIAAMITRAASIGQRNL